MCSDVFESGSLAVSFSFSDTRCLDLSFSFSSLNALLYSVALIKYSKYSVNAELFGFFFAYCISNFERHLFCASFLIS